MLMSTGTDSPHITLGSGPGSGLKIVPSFVSPVRDGTGAAGGWAAGWAAGCLCFAGALRPLGGAG